MSANDPYEKLAVYYDRLHEDLDEDLPFWVAVAAERVGPVLELGCGSGRVLRPLADAGIDAIGLDRSAAMLDLARTRLRAAPAGARWELVQADMTDFRLPRSLALIFAAYNTWTHLDDAAQDRALACARRQLAPGGRLALDLPNPLALLGGAQAPEETAIRREFFASPGDEMVVADAHSRWLPARRLVRVTWEFSVSGSTGGSGRRSRLVVDHHLRYPHELELALRRAGLKLEALYGDYERSPFGEASERLILMAQAAS